jgi:hypothetical protein
VAHPFAEAGSCFSFRESVGFDSLFLTRFGSRETYQGTTSVGPYSTTSKYFLAPQARAQRSGAEREKVLKNSAFISRPFLPKKKGSHFYRKG